MKQVGAHKEALNSHSFSASGQTAALLSTGSHPALLSSALTFSPKGLSPVPAALLSTGSRPALLSSALTFGTKVSVPVPTGSDLRLDHTAAVERELLATAQLGVPTGGAGASSNIRD